VLVDEEHTGNTNVFVDAGTVLGRRRGHGATNRLALLELLMTAARRKKPRRYSI
jgi:hypothetical protein